MTKLQMILSAAPVCFDTPVLVKPVPVSYPVRIYEIQKTEAGAVMLRISDGSFHQLEESDYNYDRVADSIIDRLKLMQCAK